MCPTRFVAPFTSFAKLARCRNRRNEIALRLEIRKKSGKPRGGSPRAAYVVIVERGH
jgi:hypothetical protein